MIEDKEKRSIEGRDKKTGKFVKGNKYNEINPHLHSRKSQIRKLVLNSCIEKAPELIKKMLELALDGDVNLLRYIMDRILPPLKATEFMDGEEKRLENIVTQEDVNIAMTEVIRDIGRGEISIEEGFQVANILDKKAQSIQICLQKELTIVQERLDEISGK